mmetsp:Transcript_2153/g.4466  ORF Transcript_2153/g.4466 Transcript_2153/m.4466 type:complete len:262 (+) Transcript_2153:43-828(+)
MAWEAGVEVPPHVVPRLLSAVVDRMREALSHGAEPADVRDARMQELQGWGLHCEDDLERCIQTLATDDAFAQATLRLYREFAAKARTEETEVEGQPNQPNVTLAQGRGDADLDTLDKGLSDVERLKLLSEWHKEAADPDVQGRVAMWEIPRWSDTLKLSRRPEAVWSEEFFLAGRTGLRIGILPRGADGSHLDCAAVLLLAPEGDVMDVSITVGGIAQAKKLKFPSSTSQSFAVAGWPNYAAANDFLPSTDGSLDVRLEIR